MIKIAGIARKTEFSPNHELNDFLMIQKTAEELKNLGAKVKVYREEDLFNEEFSAKLFRSQISYFEDIDYEEEVVYLDTPVDKEEIKKYLIEAATEKF